MFMLFVILCFLFVFLVVVYISVFITALLKTYEKKIGIYNVDLNNTRECNNCGFVNNEYYLLNYNLIIGNLSTYSPLKNYECPVCSESKGHRLIELDLNKTFALKKYGFLDRLKLIYTLNRIKKDKTNKNTRDFEIKQLTIIQDQLNNVKYVVKDGVLNVEKIKEDKVIEKETLTNQVNGIEKYELRGGIGNKIIKNIFLTNKDE